MEKEKLELSMTGEMGKNGESEIKVSHEISGKKRNRDVKSDKSVKVMKM